MSSSMHSFDNSDSETETEPIQQRPASFHFSSHMRERSRSRSPSSSNRRSTSPAAGRSVMQEDEIATGRGLFGRFGGLCDRQFQIRPWGFVDRALEEKFIEYHWLTFITNYKGEMQKMWGSFTLLHCLFTAHQLSYEEEIMPVAISLVRVVLSSTMVVVFSRRNNLFIKRAWEFLTLVWFKGILPFIFTAEFTNPATSQLKFTLQVFLVTFLVFLMFPSSWRSMCWAYFMGFWVPAVIIFLRTWEEKDHVIMMKRAELLPLAGTVGPLIGALFSVQYRKSWALASWRAGRSTKLKEDASCEGHFRRRPSGRSASPLSRLAEENRPRIARQSGPKHEGAAGLSLNRSGNDWARRISTEWLADSRAVARDGLALKAVSVPDL